MNSSPLRTCRGLMNCAGKPFVCYAVKQVVVFFAVFIITANAAEGQDSASVDYSFDASGFEKKPFEYSASIEAWPTLLLLNHQSPLYHLKYPADDSYADLYNSKIEGLGRYQYRQLLANVSGSFNIDYPRYEDTIGTGFTLYEGYLKYIPSTAFSITSGKRTFRWGKGYVYNPVAFAGRQKDLNNIDATLEGYWNLSIDYTKSFTGPLSSLAASVTLLPVYKEINASYLPDRSVSTISQIYFLLLNTDIDLTFYFDDSHNFKTGTDFSRNIFPNWEVHSEWAYESNHDRIFFNNDSSTVMESKPANNFIAGTRYQTPFDAALILEYLYQGSGHTQKQMESMYHALEYANSGASTQTRYRILQVYNEEYSLQFNARNYAYCKLTYPDPFAQVYWTPSIYALVNGEDGSTTAGLELTYSRFKHLFFTGRTISFLGPTESEYGIRPVNIRFELRAKAMF